MHSLSHTCSCIRAPVCSNEAAVVFLHFWLHVVKIAELCVHGGVIASLLSPHRLGS